MAGSKPGAPRAAASVGAPRAVAAVGVEPVAAVGVEASLWHLGGGPEPLPGTDDDPDALHPWVSDVGTSFGTDGSSMSSSSSGRFRFEWGGLSMRSLSSSGLHAAGAVQESESVSSSSVHQVRDLTWPVLSSNEVTCQGASPKALGLRSFARTASTSVSAAAAA